MTESASPNGQRRPPRDARARRARGRRARGQARPRGGVEVRLEVPAEAALMPIPLVTRILVADDHPIVRSGLRTVLDAQPDLEVVAEAEDGAEAVKKGARRGRRPRHPRRRACRS